MKTVGLVRCLELNESEAHFSFVCLLAVGAINLIARLTARFWSNPAGDLISRPYTDRLCEQILADWQHVKSKSCQYRTSLVGATLGWPAESGLRRRATHRIARILADSNEGVSAKRPYSIRLNCGRDLLRTRLLLRNSVSILCFCVSLIVADKPYRFRFWRTCNFKHRIHALAEMKYAF